ncbi:uncharacterized protein LOC129975248 isoform X1 [Argiope bruennichi]|uniref:uncharacterized protein LOC129975248 isoform X1 n=1 Tax=Argiope bruennichi TaxID=94029 RepID=UPI002493F1BC|nr:uncharacterized protein LOC129975248 isoform X1 [Argiope bruennichi]
MRLSTKLLFLFTLTLALIAHQEAEAKSFKKLIKAGLLLGALGSKKLPKILPIPLPIPIHLSLTVWRSRKNSPEVITATTTTTTTLWVLPLLMAQGAIATAQEDSDPESMEVEATQLKKAGGEEKPVAYSRAFLYIQAQQ